MNIPLAERIRPKTLQEYLSQQHLVGETGALTKQLKSIEHQAALNLTIRPFYQQKH